MISGTGTLSWIFSQYITNFAGRNSETVMGGGRDIVILYRVAAINPEFFSSYFQMTQRS
jgi:hypothetical protein